MLVNKKYVKILTASLFVSTKSWWRQFSSTVERINCNIYIEWITIEQGYDMQWHCAEKQNAKQNNPTWKGTSCAILLKVQVWIKLVCGVKCQDSRYFWGGRRNSDWEEARWLLSTWNVWLPLQNNSPTCALKVCPCFSMYAKYPEMFLCESETHSVTSNSLQPHKLHSPWTSPGQNTGVGILSILQGIFSTQRLNPGLLHCRRILY